MKKYFSQIIVCFVIVYTLSITISAQNAEKTFSLKEGGTVEVKNHFGRIDVKANQEQENVVKLTVDSDEVVSDKDLQIDSSSSKLKIEVDSNDSTKRIDIILQVPIRTNIKLETDAGQISIAGNFEKAEAISNTGTIYADIPIEDLKYKFLWSASLPRIVSDVELEEQEEKSAGKFVIAGKIEKESEVSKQPKIKVKAGEELGSVLEENVKENAEIPKQIKLNFRTARGIILLNVAPNEVASNLQERPLTDAAKAIIKSGDSLLTEAIRRASPKYFGDYAATLPPRRSTPFLNTATKKKNRTNAAIKKVNVQVLDVNNRAVSGLDKNDFVLSELGNEREILSVKKTEEPFNLVLLLDVSGSVENYVDFIRKAARDFVNTVSPQDKLSIVIFNEDVKTLSTFTTDRNLLSESLDTFDAGGGTAYYDSIAYVLTDTLRPMKGERTAIVVLSDGDDNRSFLPFKSLLGSLQESGALVYPLYVPSGLIAASESADLDKTVDPLRDRFLSQSLTSKAEEEGEELARMSGGVYYPISRLSQLQAAYNDIVKQLRTAYTITYRSESIERNGEIASPRLNVKVRKENTFVKVGTVVAVSENQVSQSSKRN